MARGSQYFAVMRNAYPFRGSKASDLCFECKGPTERNCARCRVPLCQLHLPDGTVCATCLNEWMARGDRTSPLLAFGVVVAGTALCFMSVWIGVLAIIGAGSAIAAHHRSTAGDRYMEFLNERPQRPQLAAPRS